MEDQGGSNPVLSKIIGGFFAAVIAPTVTGVAVWYISKRLDEPKNEAPANPLAQAVAAAPSAPALAPAVAKSEPKSTPEPARPAAPPDAPAPAPTVEKAVAKDALKTEVASVATTASTATSSSPTSPTSSLRFPLTKKKKAQAKLKVFNGNDLSGFDTYLGVVPGGVTKTAYGLNKDPEGVFTVRNGELHISGKLWGGLITMREYENYRLVVEYKWGEKRWSPRSDLPRASGIVLHAIGEPGGVRGWSMSGIVCVIGESGSGAIFVPDTLAKPISFRVEAEKRVFKKGGGAIVFKPGEPTTIIHNGTVHALGWQPPLLAAKAVTIKSAKEQVRPLGEWNRLECVCDGDTITVIFNGTTVNVATHVSQTKGKIFIESEGAEIIFRMISVRPITTASAASGPARPAPP
jgi:hypothetical protein